MRCATARFRRNLREIGKFLRGKDRVLILLKGSAIGRAIRNNVTEL